MKLLGMTINESKLLSKEELLDFLKKNGESDKALAEIREQYFIDFGNELIWRYPISDGLHMGTFIAVVKEGFISLPYDIIDVVDYEILELQHAAMFKAEDFQSFIDEWTSFSNDLLSAMRDMFKTLSEQEK